MIRAVQFKTFAQADCGCTPADIIFCIPVALAAEDVQHNDTWAFLEGTLVSAHLCDSNVCGRPNSYTISYDDVQLASYDPEISSATIPLTCIDINGFFCRDCQVEWTETCPAGCVQVTGTPEEGDTLIFNGTDWTPAPFPLCLEQTSSIILDINGEGCLEGTVRISEDDGNVIDQRPDGLYVPNTAVCVLSSDTVTLSIDGDGCITAAVTGEAFRDGWIPFGVTASYVSSNSFSVPGDWTAIIGPGDKINITQTTQKFFSVLSAGFFAGITTFLVTAGATFTVANAPITLPFYSHAESPFGFSPDFAHVPTFVGFATPPVGGSYTFFIKGKFVYYFHRDPGNGVSDDTIYTINAPVPLVSSSASAWVKGTGTNNSVYQPDILAEMGGGIPLTDIAFSTAGGSSSWTAANIKQARVTPLIYQYSL